MTSTTNRFAGIRRDYAQEDVAAAGLVVVEHTLARLGAERLWQTAATSPFVPTLGALTGNQALQQVKAGLEAIYLSGWQVAADANNAGEMYPDQSLYPASSVPEVVRRINKTFARRPDRQTRGRHPDLLVRADRGRCRGRLRRPAQRLRADEGDDRGRRRGRALRGPAGLGEEVRPPRRQGAGADQPSSARSMRRVWRPTSATCRRCSWPHRCPNGEADHQRRRRARRPFFRASAPARASSA